MSLAERQVAPALAPAAARAAKVGRAANEDRATAPAAGRRATLWPVYSVLFLMTVESVISAFTYPYFALALEKVGLSNWLIGLNASLAGAGILFVGPFLPRLIALLGVRRFVAATFALPILSFAAILAADHPAVWFAARFVLGACFAASWATTEIWLNGIVSDRHRGRIMSLAMILYTGAQFVGPLMVRATGIGGWLPLVAAMVPLAIGAAVTLAIRHRVDAAGTEAHAPEGSATFRQALAAARSLILVAFAVGLASTAIQGLLPIFGLSLGLSDERASDLVAVFGLGELILVGAFGVLADRFGRWQLFRLSAVPTMLLAAAIPIVGQTAGGLTIALFLAGGTLGGIYTLGLILIGQDYSGQRLAVVSTGFAMAYSAGAVIGATPIGLLIDLFGPMALLLSIALSLLALAWFVTLKPAAVAEAPLVQDNAAVASGLDEGEAVDVEQTEVGDLEVGDDRQRKERDLEKWFLERASEATRRAAQRYQAGTDDLERAHAHQARERQRELRQHRAA